MQNSHQRDLDLFPIKDNSISTIYMYVSLRVLPCRMSLRPVSCANSVNVSVLRGAALAKKRLMLDRSYLDNRGDLDRETTTAGTRYNKVTCAKYYAKVDCRLFLFDVLYSSL